MDRRRRELDRRDVADGEHVPPDAYLPMEDAAEEGAHAGRSFGSRGQQHGHERRGVGTEEHERDPRRRADGDRNGNGDETGPQA